MSQTLVKNYVHIVFSTQDRYPWIDKDIGERLFAYIGGICQNLSCHPVQVGGYKNHVHILCNLSKNISLSRLLQIVKTDSCKWIKKQDSRYKDFRWQLGYGTFSVNERGIENLKKYIQNQKEHHSKKDFKEEYRSLLKNNKMEFDEKYLWT